MWKTFPLLNEPNCTISFNIDDLVYVRYYASQRPEPYSQVCIKLGDHGGCEYFNVTATPDDIRNRGPQ